MIDISMSSECLKRLTELLAQEDDDNSLFRIRETKKGAGCKSCMTIVLSLDDEFDQDEDVTFSVNSIPFVASNDVIDTYGKSYSINLNEQMVPIISSNKSCSA